MLKRTKPVIQQVQPWTKDSVENLRDCFESTDWDLFFNDFNCCVDLELSNDTITSYINFCSKTVVQTKKVRIFPHNKPWNNKDLKQLLNKKGMAFLKNETHRVKECVKELNKEIKHKIREAQRQYKRRVEEKFIAGNVRDAWRGLNIVMGRQQKQVQLFGNDPH